MNPLRCIGGGAMGGPNPPLRSPPPRHVFLGSSIWCDPALEAAQHHGVILGTKVFGALFGCPEAIEEIVPNAS